MDAAALAAMATACAACPGLRTALRNRSATEEKNLFRIAAPAYFGSRRVGLTERIFNATTGELLAVPKEG